VKLKNSHLLDAQELASVGIGESPEQQLKWFLSFVNQGVWKRERKGPGLDSLSFAGGLRATHDAYGKLEKEVQAFCGYKNSARPFTRSDLIRLQSIGANMLVSIAKNGIFSHKISECTLVLFPEGKGKQSKQKIWLNIDHLEARFILELKTVLEFINLNALRSCPVCLKVFYADTRQVYCVPNGSCSNRDRQKRHYWIGRAKKRTGFGS
jgi:hypothetical protein